MHDMSPENMLLVIRLEREHQLRNRVQLDRVPATPVVQRLRQYFQQFGRHQVVGASECCSR